MLEELILLLKYIFLGMIQGLTEPLPVSSSGHLRIVSYFFGIDVPDLHLEIFLNGASLIAVFIVYRRDLIELIQGCFHYLKNPKQADKAPVRFATLLIVGTIPAVIIGGLFSVQIGEHFTGIYVVGFALLITGTALWLIRKLRGHKKETEISMVDALIVGLAQTVALAPGISRSGATVVAALARKVEPETALKFSFFLSIPVSVGSIVLKIDDITAALTTPGLAVPYIVAFFVSVFVSIFAIKLFINLVTNGNLLYFAIYCFIVSGLIFLFA